MKKQICALLATALVASMGMAQESSSTTSVEPTVDVSSKGFRVTLLKPFLDAKIKATYGSQSSEVKQKISDSVGVAIGYAYLHVQHVGGTVNLAYFNLKDSGSSFGAVRLDGNVGYAFNEIVSVKGGLNVSKLTGNKALSDFNPGIGAQISVGLQATTNLGFDIGSAVMSQSSEINGATVEIQEGGLELGVHGTF